MDDKNYLKHYGVLGMKWGVRKDKTKSNVVSSKTSIKELAKNAKSRVTKKISERKAKAVVKRTTKESVKKASQDKSRNIKRISNEELAKRVNRLEMEKKYRELKKSQVSSGARIAKNILEKSIENIGTQLGAYTLGTLVNKLAGSDIVNPKKGQKDGKK